MLVVDDAHWADGESLRWLDYLARRAQDTAVLIVIGARTGEPDEPTELEALRQDATEGLHPGALSDAAVDRLIAAELGAAPHGEFSHACNRATGGNPFLLTEVLRTLRTRSVAPNADGADEVASLGPEPVARSVRQRLHGFGEEAVAWRGRSPCSAVRRRSDTCPNWRESARTARAGSATACGRPNSCAPAIRSTSSTR